MKYRYLKDGERIKIDDEFKSSIDNTWCSFRKHYGKLWFALGHDKDGFFRDVKSQVPIRRKIKGV
jgi:hypothetical protein